MSETLEELEEKYFMLEMQDTWSRLFELGKSC